MKFIRFKEHNVILGEKQSQYDVIPAFRQKAEGQPVTVCIQLNKQELEQVNKTGRIWLKQLTHGIDLAPYGMSLLKKDNIPAKVDKVVEEPKTIDERRNQLDFKEG